VNAGVPVSTCTACDWNGLPERLWCPLCGSGAIRIALVHAGAVEEVTIVRKAVGRGGGPVRVGTVRLAGGGALLARLEPGAAEGSRVRLYDDHGAAVARPI
jgi:uncharacterized OB-fold protein